MRAPFQEGDFPGPVKYGYLNVGHVEQGPPELRHRTVFSLYPHQTSYVVPAPAVAVVPDDVPARRAVLAGTVETAVNALWDAAPLVGDRVTVVGAGHGRLLRGPAARPDAGRPGHPRRRRPDPGRRRRRAGGRLRPPGGRRRRPGPGRAHQRDLGRAAAVAGPARAGGDRPRPQLVRRRRRSRCRSAGRSTPAGSRIVASQVGTLAPARRSRRTTADRLALALDLLRDPAFDALLTGESGFAELPDVMSRLASGSLPALCHTITYDEG